MPKIRFRNIATGTTQDADGTLPLDATPYGGSEATIRPKAYRTAAAPAVVLPPVNQIPPVIDGLSAVAATLSLSGFDWDGANSFSYRWLANGVFVGSSATYTVQPGDQGKTISAEMQGSAGGASSGWVAATNVVFIPTVTLAVVTADEWETYEATADADTRKTFMRVNDTPTAGYEFVFWLSSTPGPENVTLTTLEAFTFVTDHYEATSSSQAAVGTADARSTQYVRIAERNIADPTNTGLWRWVSETKTYLSSSTPSTPVVAVTQGTTTGEIRVNITTVADPSGRAVTRYEYRVGGAGSWIDLGGGLGVGPRSITGFIPLQSYTIEVRAVNVNGVGIATAPVTVIAGETVTAAPVTTLVFGSQQFELSGAYTVVTHIDGPKCIVSSSPVTIVSKTPAINATLGAVRNGAMKNPPRGYQAFDTRIGQIDMTKLVSFPLSLAPNDILLSAVSMPETGVEGSRSGYVNNYDMVYVAAVAPDPLSLAPTVTPWTGRTTLTAGPVIDYMAKAALLPTTYDAPGVTYRTIAETDKALRFNPINGLTHKASSSFPDAGYEPTFPNWWGSPAGKDTATVNGNYGQFVNARITTWVWQLCAPLTSVPIATKANILMRLCSFAWQTWQGWENNNTRPPGTGDGHFQMHQAPFALLFYLTGNDTAMSELRAKYPGVWNVFFYHTAETIPLWFAPWGNPDVPGSMNEFPYPAHYFRRRITAVNAVAKTVTIPTYTQMNPGGQYGGSSKERWANLILWREIDGVNARISSSGGDWIRWPGTAAIPGEKVITLSTWPAEGFAVGDIVYAKAPWTPTAGDPDWRITNQPNHYNASAAMSYRNQAMVLGQIAFLRALGLHRPEWQAIWDYALYDDLPDKPIPENNFNTAALSANFVKIWAANKAAILAVPQPNLTQPEEWVIAETVVLVAPTPAAPDTPYISGGILNGPAGRYRVVNSDQGTDAEYDLVPPASLATWGDPGEALTVYHLTFSSAGPTVAFPAAGFTEVETWSAYAAGNTFTELDALYARTSTNLPTTVSTQAAGPAGLGVQWGLSSGSSPRIVQKDTIATALASRVPSDVVQVLFKIRQGTTNFRGGIGWTNSSVFTGFNLLNSNGTNRQMIIQTEGDVSTGTNQTVVLTGIAADAIVWGRFEIEGPEIRGKAWVDGTGEPGSWTSRSHSGDLTFNTMGLVGRVGATGPICLGYSIGINTAATSF